MVRLKPIVHMWDWACWGSPFCEGISKEYPIRIQVLEEATKNSKKLDWQVRKGIESRTFYLSVLRAELLGYWRGNKHKEIKFVLHFYFISNLIYVQYVLFMIRYARSFDKNRVKLYKII